MMMIILTPEECALIRGESSSGNFLIPREMANGNFALPARVLSDPAHASKHDFLEKLPQLSLSEIQWPVDPDEEI